MMQEIKKELKYGIRSGKMLILLLSFLFFAFLTPVMLSVVLPEILLSQGASPQDLSGITSLTQTDCIQVYMNDVFEMGTIIVAFTICGLLAQEIQDNTLVLPLCSGNRIACIVLGKLMVFGFFLAITPLLALTVNYLYSGMLYSFELGILPIIRAGLLQGLYMIFLLVELIMWGAVVKKPIPTGFLTLATVFGMHLLGSLLGIREWFPTGLLVQAQNLTEVPEPSLSLTLIITIVIIASMFIYTLISLKKIEWNTRST